MRQQFYGAYMTRLLSTKDVAKLFNVTDRTICNWVKSGALKLTFTTPGGAYKFSKYAVDLFRDSLRNARSCDHPA